jgi:hypothetical protein|tara:strand:- start:36486 stop:38570 length:2085 start_codon:yes stop_codon:yes gene_type:complete
MVVNRLTGVSGKVDISTLTDEDFSSMIQAARPYNGGFRDSYQMSLARQWWINLLYYLGIQSLEAPEVLENLDPGMIMQDGGYVANQVMRLVMGNVGRLTSAKIDWSVVPNTPDQEDQDGAKVGQNILDYLGDHLDLAEKRTEIALWLDICGTCYAYHNWDTETGDVRRQYKDPQSGQPIEKKQLNPSQQEWLDEMQLFTEERDGDWDVEVLSGFDVFVPPRFVKLSKMPWIMVRRTMSIDQVWDRWPEKAAEIPPNGSQSASLDQYRNRLATVTKRPGLGLANSRDEDGAVDVDELWIPPSKRCPTGVYIAATGNHIYEAGPHKFAEAGLDMRFPITDFHNIRVPGRHHSMSTVEHLIGPQNEYNRARQQVIAHRDVLSVPQWIAPIGTLSKNVVRNEMGDILEYNPRIGRPELVNPPPLGDAQIVSGQQAQADMQMISSFSDASLGQMPQGARSGNAITLLTERDQTGISPTVAGLEKSFANMGRSLLQLGWKFMQFPRAVAVYGETRQSDIHYFSGSDLNGNCRVSVTPGSMTPKSKAQAMEVIGRMAELGVLNAMDPREKRLILEAIEVGGTDKLFLSLDGNRRRANIENMMYAKPSTDPNFTFPDVNQYDDHEVHFEAHRDWMLTDQYERLDPFTKQMFLAHIAKHEMAVAQMMQAAAMVQGGQGGGGGSPEAKPLGQPSAPNREPVEAG